MGRTNSEGQRDRGKAGRRFEETTGFRMKRVVESFEGDLSGLELLEGKAVTERFPWTAEKAARFDKAIVRDRTHILLTVGCKTSARERWRQDDRDAMILKKRAPTAQAWLTLEESLGDTAKQNMLRAREGLDAIYFADPDRFVSDLKNFLRLFVEPRKGLRKTG